MENAMQLVGIYLFLCSACLYHIRAQNSSIYPTTEEALEKITQGYNKKLRPNFHGPPVKIVVNTYIVAVDNVNDVKSDFMVKMYFAQTWNDSRLAYGKKYPGIVKRDSIRITGTIVREIWIPDTYLENEEAGGSVKVFSSVKIDKYGLVQLSRRLTIKANCPTMNLKLFPHDIQSCILSFTSYAYPNYDLTYEWKSDEAVQVGESTIASQYILDETVTRVEQQYFKGPNATWTYIKLEFILRRKIAYYVIRIYLPAILVTLTSWVSFFVDPTAIPARLSLCVITVLAMTTLSYNSQSMVPSVPYVKAVDIYLIMSFFFVFGSLIEYAILLNVTLRCQRRERDAMNKNKTEEIPLNHKRRNSDAQEVDKETGKNGVTTRALNGEKSGYFSSWTLDNCSTVVFPSAYLLFHFLYFLIILT